MVDSLLRELETDAAQARDGRELLAKLLDSLAPRERMILTLLHIEEKPVAEIAAMTGWNWQLRYDLKQPKLIPRRSTVKVTAVYDNIPANEVNPDRAKCQGSRI